MIPANVKCVLLDMGMVLVDIDYTPFVERMRLLAGTTREELRRIFASESLIHDVETGRLSESGFHREVCKSIGKELSEDEFRSAWNSIFKKELLVPEDLIRSLADTAELWALSNTNPIHFDYISKHYSFPLHFRGFVLSYRAGSRKPDSAIFEYALGRAGVTAAEALFVDDQPANVEAALKLGIDAFQFSGADHFEDEMRRRGLV